MGRTIPSFRVLIDIEKLEWKQFRKYLCRQDKKIFNKLSSIPKLYCHSLSDLANPIIIQSIFMAILFHNEKTVHLIMKEQRIGKKPGNLTQESFKDKNCQQIMDNWSKFIDCLNKDDKTRFIEMIKECYLKYSKSIMSSKRGKFDPRITESLLMALIFDQQKQIDKIKNKRYFEFFKS